MHYSVEDTAAVETGPTTTGSRPSPVEPSRRLGSTARILSDRSAAILQARAELARAPVYLDTETTGTGWQDQIVEICLVDSDGAVLFESLVKPTRPIPSEATALHGITNAMVQNAPPWREVWSRIEGILRERRVGIYNAAFDLRLMKQSHVQDRLPWCLADDAFFCIMQLYARYYGVWDAKHGDYRWQSLEDAARQCRIGQAVEHRARSDALLARAVLHYIAAQEP